MQEPEQRFIARHVRFPNIDTDENETNHTASCIPCTVYENKECYICLQEHDVSDYVFVNCNAKHVYGKGCIMKWFKNHKTCPICREILYNEELVCNIMVRGKCSREMAIFIYNTYGKYIKTV
jgi:hypothetical protein